MRALIWLSLAGCAENLTPPAEPPPSPVASCVPDRDGTITAAELPVALDVAADFYVGENRTVDLAGSDGRWDLSEETNDDVDAVGAAPLGAQWYAASYPAGRFVVTAGPDLDAIYSKDDAALWLHGTASTTETPRTLIVYDPPVAAIRLPLRDGDVAAIDAPLPSATIAGLPFVGSDRFEIEVAGTGRVDLPYVRFSPALRVRTRVVRTSGAASTSKRTTSFVFECFGEIARAESRLDEPAADFTVAAYLRRFAL
jgi:hypothetical protein